jgi:hypothetical protein
MNSKHYTNLSKLLVAGATSFYGATAFATPTLYPQDFNLLSNIQNPTNSNIIADDTDPHTLYVMPPNTGYGSSSGMNTLTANLNFCRNMQSLADQTLQIEQKESDLRLQMGDQIAAIKKFESQITAAKLDLANYATGNHLSDLASMDGDIATATSNLQNDYKSLNNCTNTCDDIQKDVAIQQSTINTLTNARNKFEAQNIAACRAYDEKKALVTSLTEQRDAVTGDYETLITALANADSQIMSLYSSYGTMEGARAAFTYDSGWDENTAALRIANPGYNIVKLDAESATIFPGILGVQGLPPTGAIIGFETPGAATQKDGGIAMASFPSMITGNAVMSLIGACPAVYPNFFRFQPGVDSSTQKFGMLITYQYPSTMKLSMTATYNMYKMYQLIKDSGSSGGLFSSHSWSNTEERNYFRDAFHVDWTSQDPGNMLTDDQRMAQERAARDDIYSRLYALAIPTSPDKSLLLAAGAPPQHGAVVVADDLMKACPGNVYCVAGSFILQGLDAIFGSSSTSSSYTQIQDIDLQETWSLNKVVMKPGITTFNVQ